MYNEKAISLKFNKDESAAKLTTERTECKELRSKRILSLLQKLTTERTENTEYKELTSKRILERLLRKNIENFVRY